MSISNRVVLEEIFSIAPSLGAGSFRQMENDTASTSGTIGLRLIDTGEFVFLKDGMEWNSSETLTGEDVAHVFKARFEQDLTPSETRLLMQLIAGGTLPDLSKQDGVSYGTRRNQLAAIRQKADRKRQSDVVVIIAVLCANYLRKFDARPDGAGREIVDLFAKFYKTDFRMYRPTMSSGRELVVVDVGPIDGRKVLFMHPVSLPFAPLPHDAAFLWQNNIRVLTPIRPGYFGVPAKRTETLRILQEFSDDFVEFLKVIGAEHAPIASHTYGIANAILIAKKKGRSIPATGCRFTAISSWKSGKNPLGVLACMDNNARQSAFDDSADHYRIGQAICQFKLFHPRSGKGLSRSRQRPCNT